MTRLEQLQRLVSNGTASAVEAELLEALRGSGLCSATACGGHCGYGHALGCDAIRECLADHGGDAFRAQSSERYARKADLEAALRERDEARASVAALRDMLIRVMAAQSDSTCKVDWGRVAFTLSSPNPGAGWVSPEVVGKVREALEAYVDAFMEHGTRGHPHPLLQQKAAAALALLEVKP